MFSKSSSRIFDTSRLSGGIASSRLRLTASSSCRSIELRTCRAAWRTSRVGVRQAHPGSTSTNTRLRVREHLADVLGHVVFGPEVLLVVDRPGRSCRTSSRATCRRPLIGGSLRRRTHVVDDADAAGALALHDRLEDRARRAGSAPPTSPRRCCRTSTGCRRG